MLLQRRTLWEFRRTVDKNGAQHLGHCTRVGVAKLHDARLDPTNGNLRIEPLAQHVNHRDGFFFARDNHRIRAIVDRDRDVLRERFACRAARLRFHLRSLQNANLLSLREEFTHHTRKLCRLDVRQRNHANHRSVRHWKRVEKSCRFFKCAHVVGGRREYKRVTRRVRENLDGLLKIKRDRCRSAVWLNAQPTHLLLERARQIALLRSSRSRSRCLRNHRVECRGDARCGSVLHAHDAHFRIRTWRISVDRLEQ